ncbi:MAG: DUF4097 family beta strand repeat-containing protein [Candidatus Zixiibacteriota bacterium]
MSDTKPGIFLFAIMTLLIAASAVADEYTFDYQKILDITAPAEVSLYVVKGNVTVKGGDQNKVVIEAIKTIAGSSREEAEEVAGHVEIKVRQEGSAINVETNYLKMVNRSGSFWSKIFGAGGSDSYGSVDFTITVPTRTSVSIMCLDGQVNLSSLEGQILVENRSGSSRGEYLFGPVTLIQETGDIELNWVEGDIKIKSTSSMISIIQVRGAIDLTTSAGKVNIQTELDSPNDFYVETTSGSIVFSVPTSSSGMLDIATESGEIRTEVPITVKSVSRKRLVGEFGSGGPTVSLSSVTGDVDVVLY